MVVGENFGGERWRCGEKLLNLWGVYCNLCVLVMENIHIDY